MDNWAAAGAIGLSLVALALIGAYLALSRGKIR